MEGVKKSNRLSIDYGWSWARFPQALIGKPSTGSNRFEHIFISGPDAELGGRGGAQPAAVRYAERRVNKVFKAAR